MDRGNGIQRSDEAPVYTLPDDEASMV